MSLLTAGLLAAADFSGLSNEEFVKQAGNLKPEEVPDYRIELNKRVENMKNKEATDFKKRVRKASMDAIHKLPPEEHKQYMIAVCKAMQAKTDNMTGKQIREAGLDLPRNDCDKVRMPKKPADHPKGSKTEEKGQEHKH